MMSQAVSPRGTTSQHSPDTLTLQSWESSSWGLSTLSLLRKHLHRLIFIFSVWKTSTSLNKYQSTGSLFYFWLKQRVKFPHPLSRFLQIYLQLFLLSHFKFSPFFSLHRLIKSHLMFLQEFGTSIPGGVQKMTASDTSWDGSVGMRDWSKAGLDLRNLCYNFVIL